MGRSKTGGWHWPAFLLGPIWYFSKGMILKGFWLSILCVVTVFFAAPFIWIYCGARGRGDWYDYRLKRQSTIDIDEI